jgi:hypothetical protein
MTTSDIFARLADGPALMALVDRALVSGGSAAYSSDAANEALQLASDPRASEILPCFGMERVSVTPPPTRQHPFRHAVQVWRGSYPFTTFWNELRQSIAGAIQTIRLPDGTAQQTFAATEALGVWQTTRDAAWHYERVKPAPDQATASLHIAAALAFIGGLPWQLTDDGIARVLPNQPLRLIPRGGLQPPFAHLKNQLAVPCVGWACIPSGSPHNDEPVDVLVAFSGVGNQKKLKAAWATLMDSKRDLIKLPQLTTSYHGGVDVRHVAARRPEGKGVYDTFWNDAPLAESGMAHLVIQHRSLLRPRSLMPFLHLTGEDGLPDLALFLLQLEAASDLPIVTQADRDLLGAVMRARFQPPLGGEAAPALTPALITRAERLWQGALKAGLITRLPSYGCAAYWVVTDNLPSWAAVLAGRTTAAPVRIIGASADDTPPGLAVPLDEAS